MPLTETQKRHLRKLGHALKPVVMVGANGLTDAVCQEADGALSRHELIKVRVSVADRQARDATIVKLYEHCNAELVQRIGHIALLFRRNPQHPRISF